MYYDNVIIKIERLILSSIMFQQNSFCDIIAKIDHSYFVLPIHRFIFKAFEELDKKGLDFTPELICLEVKKDMAQIKLDDIILIMAETPLANIDEYVLKIMENNKATKVFNHASNLRNLLENNSDLSQIDSILLESIRTMESINDSIRINEHVKNLAEWEAHLKENEQGNIKYQLGVDFLDNALKGGLKLNQLVLIAGDAESGKTSLGLQILHNLSINHKTCYFSLEFSAKDYVERSSKVDKFLLKEKRMSNEIYHKVRENRLCDTDTRELKRLELSIINLAKQGVKFFLIDSQMCIEVHDETYEVEKQNKKFQTLHKLVQKYDIAIFFIVQFSKGDKSSPYGSVIGQYVPSIVMVVERNQKDDKYEYAVNVKKNKQEGICDKYNVFFDKNTLMFQGNREHKYKSKESVVIHTMETETIDFSALIV